MHKQHVCDDFVSTEMATFLPTLIVFQRDCQALYTKKLFELPNECHFVDSSGPSAGKTLERLNDILKFALGSR